VIAETIVQASQLPATHRFRQAKNNVSALELKRHLGVC
jgi:hypothetical protein